MKSVLVGLCGLVAPGFAHGLMGQRRLAWIIFVLTYLAVVAMALTVWALLVVFAIVLGAVVHAGLLHRRLGRVIRWSWLDAVLVFAAMIVASTLLRGFVVEAFKTPSSSMYPTLELGDHFFINKLAGLPKRGDVIVFGQPCTPERDYVKRVVALGGDTIEVRCGVTHLNGKPVQHELVDASCTYEDLDENERSIARSCARYRETIDGRAFDIFLDREQPERDRLRADSHDHNDFPEDVVAQECSSGELGARPTEQRPGKVVVTNNTQSPCAPYMHYIVPPDSVFVMGDNRVNSTDSRRWGTVPLSYVKGPLVGRWFPLSRFGGL